MAVSYPIRLVKWQTAKDGSGDLVETVVKNISTFAEVTDIGGSRFFNQGDTSIVHDKQFRIRFNPNYNPTGNWRVIFHGHSYTITEIERENEKSFFWLFKGTAEGKR